MVCSEMHVKTKKIFEILFGSRMITITTPYEQRFEIYGILSIWFSVFKNGNCTQFIESSFLVADSWILRCGGARFPLIFKYCSSKYSIVAVLSFLGTLELNSCKSLVSREKDVMLFRYLHLVQEQQMCHS